MYCSMNEYAEGILGNIKDGFGLVGEQKYSYSQPHSALSS